MIKKSKGNKRGHRLAIIDAYGKLLSGSWGGALAKDGRLNRYLSRNL